MQPGVADAVRFERCEHVWAEVINVRGESMTRTVDGLIADGFSAEAELLREVSTDSVAWEEYNRSTFLAHASVVTSASPGKLRYLVYTTKATDTWWRAREHMGAVIL